MSLTNWNADEKAVLLGQFLIQPEENFQWLLEKIEDLKYMRQVLARVHAMNPQSETAICIQGVYTSPRTGDREIEI